MLLLLAACAPDPAPNTPTACDDWVVLHADVDGDGYGDPALSVRRCAAVDGWVDDASDCDDTRVDVSPVGVEVCDAASADEDCDGVGMGETEWYSDADGDGYGVSEVLACAAPTGYASRDGDCDDADATAHPDQAERCDGIDTDCDAATSEYGLATWEADVDATAWLSGDLALDTPGDLRICGGTWHTRLTITADVTVLSPDGDAILDGDAAGSVVSVENCTVTLEGLTLQNGLATLPLGDLRVGGGGLRCVKGSIVYGTDLSFVGNRATIGGAVASTDCGLNLRGGAWSDNVAEQGGAGWFGGGHVEIEQADLTGNRATVAGGGLVFDPEESAFAAVADLVVSDGTAPAGAGMVVRGDTEVQVYGTGRERAGFFANTSETGGAVLLEGAAMVEFVQADLGEAGTADDNTPVDLTTAAGDEVLGDDLLGWCWWEGCTWWE